jgi:hypothetical protein
MNGPGFEWLQVSSNNTSGSVLPAPAVSFGAPRARGGSVAEAGGGVAAPVAHVSASNSNTHLPLPWGDSGGRSHAASFSASPPPRAAPAAPPEDEESIPLLLQTHELTFQESKTYMRWYSDILARTNARGTILMSDVYLFLSNFKIPHAVKEKLNRLFHKVLHAINIGEFFALLRLISHTLQGRDPSRRLIKVLAPTPTPPSILSKKRHTEDEDEAEAGAAAAASAAGAPPPPAAEGAPDKTLDLDSFTQFMLTGERPDERRARPKRRSKKAKLVKFSDQIVTDVHDAVGTPSGAVVSPLPGGEIDYSLPMDQLLARLKQSQAVQPQDDEEREILRDMALQINHFQNLSLVDKTTAGHDDLRALRPNMTGPAQMAQMYPERPPSPLQPNRTGPADMARLQPNTTGPADMARLQPNRTGPADMARLFAPTAPQPAVSLQLFTNQMTGTTLQNTMQNARTSVTGSPMALPVREDPASYADYANRPLPPPPVPQNRRNRSVTSPTPTPRMSSPLSAPSYPSGAAPPVPVRNVSLPSGARLPPPPPPARRRTASAAASTSPPPLPPKVSADPLYASAGDSTANLLTDLKALQDEVDRIRDMTGGF